ncbi:MAG TPA: YihY family inner membrane protein [Burkholderiaceae bacterium]|nr:YihY family inner membrane protein [Burkholderiaceae bacterium]
MLALTRSTIRRAGQVRLPQTAAGLTLTTALSIVPLLAVGFALFRHFPVFKPLEAAIEQHLLKSLLPAELSGAVLTHLHRFAANASGLTAVGSLFVVAAAVMMLLTVEAALNQMWDVRKARPLPRRIGLYLLMLAAGPLLVGASLWATATLLGASTGLVRSVPQPLAFVLDLAPVALCSVSLAILFHWLPHAPVRGRDAIVGGMLGGIALELGKRGFTAYLIHGPTYRSLYGAFATLPVFLLWLYFSWLVTLSAALVTARLGRAAGPRGRAASSAARSRLARARG